MPPYACIDYFNQYLVFNWTMTLWQKNNLLQKFNYKFNLYWKHSTYFYDFFKFYQVISMGPSGFRKWTASRTRSFSWDEIRSSSLCSTIESSSNSFIFWFRPNNSYLSESIKERIRTWLHCWTKRTHEFITIEWLDSQYSPFNQTKMTPCYLDFCLKN